MRANGNRTIKGPHSLGESGCQFPSHTHTTSAHSGTRPRPNGSRLYSRVPRLRPDSVHRRLRGRQVLPFAQNLSFRRCNDFLKRSCVLTKACPQTNAAFGKPGFSKVSSFEIMETLFWVFLTLRKYYKMVIYRMLNSLSLSSIWDCGSIPVFWDFFNKKCFFKRSGSLLYFKKKKIKSL
ncbi:unnamed protein product [Coccothraustes coccothraustes]